MATSVKPKETKVQSPEPPVSEHPLHHLIPKKDVFGGENYISRSIGGHSEFEIFAQAHEERHNTLIYGPTGPGKTSSVYAYAADKRIPVVNVSCNGAAEPSYFVGGWNPTKDGSADFLAGDLLLAVQHGGIIYLDEVNFLPAKIAAYLHSLLDKRRIMSIPSAQGSSVPSQVIAHKDCQIICSYNPDYEGTRPLNQAFKNRFKYKLHFDYDSAIESELLTSSALLDFASKLRDSYNIGDITTPIATNLLCEFEEINESSLGFDFAVQNFLSAFSEDEQEVVREVLLISAKNIWEDLNIGVFEDESDFAPAFKVKVEAEATPTATPTA